MLLLFIKMVITQTKHRYNLIIQKYLVIHIFCAIKQKCLHYFWTNTSMTSSCEENNVINVKFCDSCKDLTRCVIFILHSISARKSLKLKKHTNQHFSPRSIVIAKKFTSSKFPLTWFIFHARVSFTNFLNISHKHNYFCFLGHFLPQFYFFRTIHL